MDIAISKNNVPIRMTDERWYHITNGHPEVAGFYYEILETIENPEIVYQGEAGELIAINNCYESIEKIIVVIYKEISETDGFVLTAFISKKMQKFTKKKIIWKRM